MTACAGTGRKSLSGLTRGVRLDAGPEGAKVHSQGHFALGRTGQTRTPPRRGGGPLHRRISRILNQLRQGIARSLGADFIPAAGLAAGHTWCDDALLTPAAILRGFLVPILYGNTALTHVSIWADRLFSARAFCQARAGLPLAVFRTVLREMVKALAPETEATGRWRGPRTFLSDGSSFSMSDHRVLQAHFG